MKKTSLFTRNYLKKLKEIEAFNSRSFYKIYTLIDPVTMQIFYIGCTKEEIYKRVYLHSTENTVNKKEKISKNERLKNLLDNHIEPIVKVLYFIEDKKIARIVEKYLINFCSNNKYEINLLNRVNSFTVNPI